MQPPSPNTPASRQTGRPGSPILAVGLAICLTCLVTGCGSDTSPGPSQPDTGTTQQTAPVTHVAPLKAPAPPPQGYVGSQACTECHADVAAEYAGNPMARSLRLTQATAGASEVSGEFSTVNGVSYYVEQNPDGVWHHERRVSPSGEELYDQRIAMDIEVGSGTRGRSFLYHAAGRLFQSPMTWYAGEQGWALSPGYDEEFHQRFERQVTHACLSCHAGRVAPLESDLNGFSDTPIVEESIGCERCHGPGRDHVEFRRAGSSLANQSDPILNPAKLDSPRQDAVCNQCHLAGKRRVLRYGRGEFDFRPGMHLNDVWITFVKTAGVQAGAGAAVSQVEQMYESRCYQSSPGSMTCITCHDPHRSPSQDEAAGFYRQRCLQCHSDGQPTCSEELSVRQQLPQPDSCIACHMPHFAAADVHAAQTDHRILRRLAVPTGTAPPMMPTAGAPLQLFEEPGIQLPAVEADRGRGIRLAERAYFEDRRDDAEEAARLLAPILAATPNDIEGHFAAGRAYHTLGRLPQAIASWTRVVELQPRHDEALEALATACHESGDLPQAVAYYERLVAVNPNRSRYFGRMAHALGQLGRFDAGIAAAHRALELDPSLVQTHAWLANVYQHLGQPEKARIHTDRLRAFGIDLSRPASPRR